LLIFLVGYEHKLQNKTTLPDSWKFPLTTQAALYRLPELAIPFMAISPPKHIVPEDNIRPSYQSY
jgi:hypothetical protein